MCIVPTIFMWIGKIAYRLSGSLQHRFHLEQLKFEVVVNKKDETPLCWHQLRMNEWAANNDMTFLGWVMDLIPSAYYYTTKSVCKLLGSFKFRFLDIVTWRIKFKLDACRNEESFVTDSTLSKKRYFSHANV